MLADVLVDPDAEADALADAEADALALDAAADEASVVEVPVPAIGPVAPADTAPATLATDAATVAPGVGSGVRRLHAGAKPTIEARATWIAGFKARRDIDGASSGGARGVAKMRRSNFGTIRGIVRSRCSTARTTSAGITAEPAPDEARARSDVRSLHDRGAAR